MPPVQHRQYNVAVGFIGTVNTGKTTAATSYCVELAKDAYVLAHDVGWSIPTRLPDGREVRVIRHSSIEAGEKYIAQYGGQEAIHAFECSAEDVIKLGERLADSSLRAAGGYDRPAHPVVIFIDEAVLAIKDMSPQRMSPRMQELLARRRHKHIGVVWTTQHPGFVHYMMLSMGTQVYVFRCEGHQAQERLAQAGIPDELIDEVQYLEDHHYVVYTFGQLRPRELEDECSEDGSVSSDQEDSPTEPALPSDPSDSTTHPDASPTSGSSSDGHTPKNLH